MTDEERRREAEATLKALWHLFDDAGRMGRQDAIDLLTAALKAAEFRGVMAVNDAPEWLEDTEYGWILTERAMGKVKVRLLKETEEKGMQHGLYIRKALEALEE